MELGKTAAFSANCIRLCFDSYDDNECRGKICAIALEEDIVFFNLTDLIIRIDDAYNKIGQPQPHQVLRSFRETEGYFPYNSHPAYYHSSEEIAGRTGKLETIDLVMISRRRAEWQGILKNIKGTVIGKFESSVKCMELLEGMLSHKKEK